VIRITTEQAAEALARLALADRSPDAAAHQVRVELRALEPYTCRALAALLPIFETIIRQPARAEALALLAAGLTPERYTDPTGAIRYRARLPLPAGAEVPRS
jgi:hypothetical protein